MGGKFRFAVPNSAPMLMVGPRWISGGAGAGEAAVGEGVGFGSGIVLNLV